MVFGIATFVLGYAILYWGIHHFIDPRYSLWQLVGLGHVITTSPGPKVKLGG